MIESFATIRITLPSSPLNVIYGRPPCTVNHPSRSDKRRRKYQYSIEMYSLYQVSFAKHRLQATASVKQTLALLCSQCDPDFWTS